MKLRYLAAATTAVLISTAVIAHAASAHDPARDPAPAPTRPPGETQVRMSLDGAGEGPAPAQTGPGDQAAHDAAVAEAERDLSTHDWYPGG
jgi:hypothetical protein